MSSSLSESSNEASLSALDYWKTVNVQDMVRLCSHSWNNLSTAVVLHDQKKLQEEEAAMATTEANLQAEGASHSNHNTCPW